MNENASMVMSLVPFMLISIPFAIGNYLIADRLGKSKGLWVILSFVPGISFLFGIYVFYITAITILDRLKLVSEPTS